jgi:hypothetical protein
MDIFSALRFPSPGNSGQRLEDNSVREKRGHFGMVVRRRDLDYVDSPDRQLAGQPADRIEKLPAGHPTRFRCPGAWRHPGVYDVDVEREKDPVTVVERD